MRKTQIHPKKGSLIGFSANITDFSQPLSIRNSFKSENLNPGFSIMYWKGLANVLDLSVRYNGIFTNYSKKDPNSNSSYSNEFEGIFAFCVRSPTTICLTHFTYCWYRHYGGYDGTWAPYAPLGGGIQINLQSITYIFSSIELPRLP